VGNSTDNAAAEQALSGRGVSFFDSKSF
jgi:hypothetical protein